MVRTDDLRPQAQLQVLVAICSQIWLGTYVKTCVPGKVFHQINPFIYRFSSPSFSQINVTILVNPSGAVMTTMMTVASRWM